jgi:DNA-binding response OmpR family regulator
MIDYKTLYKETQKLSILLVEDFQPLREEMHTLFEDLFKQVISAKDGKEALVLYKEAYAKGKAFDLVMSDIQMPNMDGVKLTKNIREIDETQPIIILSAYSETKYLLELINIGISKFLTKPIQHDELFEVLLRESLKINTTEVKVEDNTLFVLGEGYVWNLDTQVLKHDDSLIDLTRHEMLLLELFISKQEYVCTNTDIIDTFYSHRIDMNEKNIRNLVFKLRKKIPEKCINSIYGLGYKFIAYL